MKLCSKNKWKKKTRTNQTPQHKILRAQQLQVASNTLLTKTTVSQDMNIFFGFFWCIQQHSQPNAGSGNKESIGLLVCEKMTELQSWAFPNAGLTSWVMVYFSPTVPMLLNGAGKGTASYPHPKQEAQIKELAGIRVRHMVLGDNLHCHLKTWESFSFSSKTGLSMQQHKSFKFQLHVPVTFRSKSSV